MTSFLLLPFLVSLAVAQSCNEVTDKFINERCFNLVSQQLSYQGASDYCHNHQSYLATVLDSKTASFLAAYARTTFNLNDGNFWIGLSRTSTKTSFHWDDGTPFVWSNFGPVYDGLFVAENIGNGKWRTFSGDTLLNFACSYLPNGETPATAATTGEPTTTMPKPSVTCLFMVDLQSAGIDQAAITTYQSYYNFALLVASKLNDASEFTGYLDTFGYSSGLNDHDTYPVNDYVQFSNTPFLIDGTDDDIDLDLKYVDASLTTAVWEPPTKDQTCLIFFSEAPEVEYGGTTLKTTYNSFTTVVGVVLKAGVTTIPGVTNTVVASSLSDADADSVVQKLLQSLP